MTKVSVDVAKAEVYKWLDKKKVFESTREKREDAIEIMVEAISEGVLTYNETDNTLVHELLFPFDNEKPLRQLTYKGRLNDIMLRPYLKGVASDDGDERLTAYIAALTETPKGLIKNLDTLDKKIALSIAIFFM